MSKPIKYSVFFLICTFLLTCKSKQTLISGPAPDRSQKEVFESLVSRNIDFKRFNAKADLVFDSEEQSGSGSMHLRMIKDSVVWLVIKKFGIEGARILIRPDSVFILYRLQDACQLGSISEVSDKFGIAINFKDVQQIMAGNTIPLKFEEIKSYKQEKNKCTLVAHQNGLTISYVLNAHNLFLEEMVVSDPQNRTMKIIYSDYLKTNNKFIAYKKAIFVQSELIQEANMKINFDEIEINVQKATQFNIPSNYDLYRF
jgi:hypothetical protein